MSTPVEIIVAVVCGVGMLAFVALLAWMVWLASKY